MSQNAFRASNCRNVVCRGRRSGGRGRYYLLGIVTGLGTHAGCG